MNPKHIETYISGLNKTLQDKLFFMDKIDLSGKIIIDFGCGDGGVLEAIAKKYPLVELIGVDSNSELYNIAKNKLSSVPCTWAMLKNLDTLEMIFTNRKEHDKDVVIILSSVLHELDKKISQRLFNFIDRFCDYVIIRDMYFEGYNVPVADAQYPKELSKIIAKSNPTLLAQFVERYGSGRMALVHYLMKYTYVENWQTELLEDYTSAEWLRIGMLRCETIYDHKFIQEWRKNKVMEDFGIDISKLTPTTHRELILKLNRGEVK